MKYSFESHILNISDFNKERRRREQISSQKHHLIHSILAYIIYQIILQATFSNTRFSLAGIRTEIQNNLYIMMKSKKPMTVL